MSMGSLLRLTFSLLHGNIFLPIQGKYIFLSRLDKNRKNYEDCIFCSCLTYSYITPLPIGGLGGF